MFVNGDNAGDGGFQDFRHRFACQHAVDEFLPLDDMFVIQFGVRSGFEGALRAEAGVALSVDFRRLPNTDAQELPLVLGIEIKID